MGSNITTPPTFINLVKYSIELSSFQVIVGRNSSEILLPSSSLQLCSRISACFEESLFVHCPLFTEYRQGSLVTSLSIL
jgi:hypothetical protein